MGADRDAAWREQQEILARRRNKQSNQEYFQNVQKRREDAYKNFKSKRIQYEKGKDNLEQWKKLNPDMYKAKKEYDEPDKSIPIPLISFGMPKYDNGERFDLRLPYVDNG